MKLEGIRVLDLSLFLPGPHLTHDDGRPRRRGDQGRAAGRRRAGRHIGARRRTATPCSSATPTAARRASCLNLKDAGGARGAAASSAETADVFVEAFRPGVVDRLGVGYDDGRARAIRASSTARSAPSARRARIATCPRTTSRSRRWPACVSLNLGNDGEPAMPAHAGRRHGRVAAWRFGGILMALLPPRADRPRRLHRHLDARLADGLAAQRARPGVRREARRRSRSTSAPGAARPSTASTARRTAGTSCSAAGDQVRPQPARRARPAGPRAALPSAAPGRTSSRWSSSCAATVRTTRTQAEWVEWFRGRDIVLRAGEEPARGLRRSAGDAPAACGCSTMPGRSTSACRSSSPTSPAGRTSACRGSASTRTTCCDRQATARRTCRAARRRRDLGWLRSRAAARSSSRTRSWP